MVVSMYVIVFRYEPDRLYKIRSISSYLSSCCNNLMYPANVGCLYNTQSMRETKPSFNLNLARVNHSFTTQLQSWC